MVLLSMTAVTAVTGNSIISVTGYSIITVTGYGIITWDWAGEERGEEELQELAPEDPRPSLISFLAFLT